MHGYIRFNLKINIEKIFLTVFIRDVFKQCASEYKSVTLKVKLKTNIDCFDYTIDCAKNILRIKAMTFFRLQIN